MISLKEWRAMHETIAEPVTADTAEPEPEDWEFYRIKVQGRAALYLKWLTEELAGNKLNLFRKGFIIQEVMDALGLDISQVIRITTNIKRAMQKKNRLMGINSAHTQPNNPTKTPEPAQAAPTATPPGQAGMTFKS